MNFFLKIELRRLNICKKNFCESYRIFIKNLKPENSFFIFRQLDFKNVAKLIKIFELKKCLRFELIHYIFALISRQHFEFIILDITIEFSIFVPRECLTYFHERHRIKAAWKFFHSNDWWWIIDLYCEN